MSVSLLRLCNQSTSVERDRDDEYVSVSLLLLSTRHSIVVTLKQQIGNSSWSSNNLCSFYNLLVLFCTLFRTWISNITFAERETNKALKVKVKDSVYCGAVYWWETFLELHCTVVTVHSCGEQYNSTHSFSWDLNQLSQCSDRNSDLSIEKLFVRRFVFRESSKVHGLWISELEKWGVE